MVRVLEARGSNLQRLLSQVPGARGSKFERLLSQVLQARGSSLEGPWLRADRENLSSFFSFVLTHRRSPNLFTDTEI